ncbi:MAG: hypothetical protein IPL61_39695 [Myxococcales bacterium]|nr:hypothetical protein [Myxococcales bacterium]
MSSELVSAEAYNWFLSTVIGGAATYWIGIDSYRLKKALGGDRADPAIRDRIFGSVVGIVVGCVGVVGVILHHTR